MTLGFVVKLIIEVLVFAVIIAGVLKEEKLVEFEDKILRVVAYVVKKRRAAKCRNIPMEPQRKNVVRVVKTPDNAA